MPWGIPAATSSVHLLESKLQGKEYCFCHMPPGDILPFSPRRRPGSTLNPLKGKVRGRQEGCGFLGPLPSLAGPRLVLPCWSFCLGYCLPPLHRSARASLAGAASAPRQDQPPVTASVTSPLPAAAVPRGTAASVCVIMGLIPVFPLQSLCSSGIDITGFAPARGSPGAQGRGLVGH